MASDGGIAGHGNSKPVAYAMNKTLGLQLVAYSLLLAGLSYLVHHLAPALARPTLITGLAGGALCLIWSLRALAGSRGKALPILTLIPMNFVLLSQTVIGWSGGSEEIPGRRAAAAVITLLFVVSMVMLLRIAYAGEMLDVQPSNLANKPPMAGQPATTANAGKRA